MRKFFGPELKISQPFHDSSFKTFLRLTWEKHSNQMFYTCTLMESEKVPYTLEMMINLSK